MNTHILTMPVPLLATLSTYSISKALATAAEIAKEAEFKANDLDPSNEAHWDAMDAISNRLEVYSRLAAAEVARTALVEAGLIWIQTLNVEDFHPSFGDVVKSIKGHEDKIRRSVVWQIRVADMLVKLAVG